MKNLKRIINLFLIALMLFAQIPIASAATGSCNVTFKGPSTALVGKNIEVIINASSITGAASIQSFGAILNYNSDELEYVSSSTLVNFSSGKYNPTSKRVSIYGDDSERATGTSIDFIKLVFKTKKAGTAKIEISNPEVGAVDSANKSFVLSSTSSNYSVSIVQGSNNANLSSLGVTGYNLEPAFNKDTLEYKVKVPHDVDKVTITATAEDNKSQVSNTGTKTLLEAGKTSSYTVTVKSEDGNIKSYKINVEREKKPDEPTPPVEKDKDNSLKELGVSGYTITPAFNKDIKDYNLTIPNEATEVIVNASPNSDKAQIEIIGNKDLKVGDNKVEIKVTAEDGTISVYSINVKREEKKEEPPVELDSDATLNKLNIGGFTLNPTFNKNTNVYSINVGPAVGGLNVEAIPTSSKAKVEITGNNGWKYGMNHVTIVVTAENGNKNTYIINVNRRDPNKETPTKSEDNYLNNLEVKGVELSPAFNKDISSYNVKVPYDMEKLDISYITSSNKANVKIIGNDELKVGNNGVQVEVTAEDGSIRVYTINATRSAMSSNNYLKTLIANGFTLSPNFDKNILEYNVKVNSNTNSLDLTALAENENAKVEIAGNSNFVEGKNVVLVKVTDENGFTKFYQINVTKPSASVMGMNIGHFLLLLFLGLGLIASIILLIILLRRKKDKNEKKDVPTPPSPVIDFKPEFNFGSRNGTDDDVVYPGGVLNQGNGAIPTAEPKKLVEEAHYEDLTDEDYEDITKDFNFYDETITKEELIAAIREGMATNNTDKLKMLLKQDELNQLKKAIKRKEMSKTRSDRYDD